MAAYLIVPLVNAEDPMASRGPPAPSRRVLCGGDYRHRARDALVTVLDVEMRHGRATGRLVAVETSGAVRLPFVCREEDLVLATPTRTAVREESAPAAGARRRGRRRS